MQTTHEIQESELLILALTSGAFVTVVPCQVDNFFRQYADREVCRFTWDQVSDTVREVVRSTFPGIQRHGFAFVTSSSLATPRTRIQATTGVNQ